jgi:Alw26I/Eco31I/Esp3I family type II restriction endonuclease
VFNDLPKLFICKAVQDIPRIPPNVEAWTKWLEEVYVPSEPSLLGPGAMSNAPDRLDGFHSFNRCCRGSADKGRSRENLASYSTDRRAFEFWSDGNWITANKLMGAINSDPDLMRELCLNDGDGRNHPRPCSADHIGPISLGFSHRASFQLLCKPCNSAKNNRMYLSDVMNLIVSEENGAKVTSWYADSVWQRLKQRVSTKEDALRLSRIMRDNRFNALLLLGSFLEKEEYLFLYSLLNLEYAAYSYDINRVYVDSHIVTADFRRTISNLKYVHIQQARKVRVAFSSLGEYYRKERRNGLEISLPRIEALFDECIRVLEPLNTRYSAMKSSLARVLTKEDASDEMYISVIQAMPALKDEPEIKQCKALAVEIMDTIAENLSSRWDDDRYIRDQDERE